MSPINHAEIVHNLTELLRVNYIFPDIAAQICARLQERLENGEYADFNEGGFFAYALTLHLQEFNHDEHLWVRWHPQPLPEQEGQLRLNEEWVDRQQQEARLDNYGFHKAERLPGNIGYLDIRYFYRPEWGSDTAAAAMSLVANTEALIIDLRKCPGGYPAMIARVASYLFGEEPQHLVSVYWRDDDTTQEFWTLPQVPGCRFGDKPVYLLTSKATFSGGEGFAYALQNRKRAIVVGEQTDGGANPGASYQIHPHFEAFIPVGRVTDPLTGTNWEGVGVTPDVPVPKEQALKTAYGLALETIIKSPGKPVPGPLSLLMKEAQAALEELEKKG